MIWLPRSILRSPSGCSLPLHSVLGVLKQAILANRAGDLTGAVALPSKLLVRMGMGTTNQDNPRKTIATTTRGMSAARDGDGREVEEQE